MNNIEKLREMVKIQTQDGNWNYDPYMHGMANGLLLALATIENEEPKFLDAPKCWLFKATDNAYPHLADALSQVPHE